MIPGREELEKINEKVDRSRMVSLHTLHCNDCLISLKTFYNCSLEVRVEMPAWEPVQS